MDTKNHTLRVDVSESWSKILIVCLSQVRGCWNLELREEMEKMQDSIDI